MAQGGPPLCAPASTEDGGASPPRAPTGKGPGGAASPPPRADPMTKQGGTTPPRAPMVKGAGAASPPPRADPTTKEGGTPPPWAPMVKGTGAASPPPRADPTTKEEDAQRDPARNKDEEPPARRCSWVILQAVTRVKDLPPGEDLAFKLENPPGTSVLYVDKAVGFFNFIVPCVRPVFSVDLSRPTTPLIIVVHGSGMVVASAFNGKRYFCDAHTRVATMIPPLLPSKPSLTRAVISIGIVQDPNRAKYSTVACLLGTNSSPQFKELRCWTSTSSFQWVIKPLTSCSHHPGSQGGALGHWNKIWFVDLPFELLCCDPFVGKPELTYVTLPECCLMLVPDLRSRHNLQKQRCINISQGKICYVQLEEGMTCLWSLIDSGSPKWQLEYKAPLADIWNSNTYKTSGLTPGKVPDIAMVDPTDCAVLYFIEQDVMFSVDMRSKRVLMSKKLEMGTDFCYPSQFLHPWLIPSNIALRVSGGGGSSWLGGDVLPVWIEANLRLLLLLMVFLPPSHEVRIWTWAIQWIVQARGCPNDAHFDLGRLHFDGGPSPPWAPTGKGPEGAASPPLRAPTTEQGGTPPPQAPMVKGAGSASPPPQADSTTKEEDAQRDPARNKDEEAPARRCSWVILQAVTRGKDLPPREHLAFKLENPPGTSVLYVDKAIGYFNFIVPRAKPVFSLDLIIVVHGSGMVVASAFNGVRYFCDTHTRVATMIPPLLPFEPSLTRAVISIGIVQDPNRAEYSTNLSPQFKELRCWTSISSFLWVIKTLTNCSHHPVWGSQGGMLGHRNKIWFVDLPFPELTYVTLPESCLMLVPDLRSHHTLGKRRCIKISQGKICYAQLEEGSPKWLLADIWNGKTYKTSRLTPGKVPDIAMIDPTDCVALYFIEQDMMFSVDMRSKRVLMSKKLEMGTDFCYPSQFLHPWPIPSNMFAEGLVESNKLPSNDLHEQSDSEEDEESIMKLTRMMNMVINMLKGPSILDKLLGTIRGDQDDEQGPPPRAPVSIEDGGASPPWAPTGKGPGGAASPPLRAPTTKQGGTPPPRAPMVKGAGAASPPPRADPTIKEEDAQRDPARNKDEEAPARRYSCVKDLPPREDLAFKLENPPGTSVLYVDKAVGYFNFIVPRARHVFSVDLIIAVHGSGMVVASAFNGMRYFCDAHTRVTTMIPPLLPLEPSLTRAVISIGIVQDPNRVEYSTVACLLSTNLSPQFKELRCWMSISSFQWVIKTLTNCSHHPVWGSQGGVLGHRNKIWFVDLPFVLLCCDPFVDKPELTYVTLPESCLMLVPDLRSHHNLGKRHCIKISQGKICYAQLEEGSPKWPLADIWNGKTYKTSRLTPGKVPDIAMIDPTDCVALYFIEQDMMFSVDMRSKRVLMSKKLEMGTDFCYPSQFLHPWPIPSNMFAEGIQSNKLPSNDLHEQSDSEEDEESIMKLTRMMNMVINMLKGPSVLDKLPGSTSSRSLKL
uniref:DUF1618 domain-containing protein n=1 Tax=Oryza punctata TaxID=4537 RepID=A0A0E0MJZ3_ORYPU